ncbi:formate/nitrite transporter family protein [Zhouia sp. PK063]|uniref:formate/nitrite transporter family protein n=1 Tax=Zhouia sp. PK063 TaxID=3373602 RepID=UPI0037B60854
MTKEQEDQQIKIDNELQKSDSTGTNRAKTHGEILKQQIIEGQETYDRSAYSILLSSLTAGLEIGFSFLMICTVFFFFKDKLDQNTIFKIVALVYPIGFIMVILGQSILFTEQTSLLTLPVLNRKRSIRSLFKLWGRVVAGNLLGGYIIALVFTWLGPQLGLFDVATITIIAKHVIAHSNGVILVSAIVAGWLMGLLSWLLTSSQETVSRILIIFIITAVMSFTGLHHSIIGNVEVFSGWISSDDITLGDYSSFQGLALVGNALGGAIFVALLKYRAFVYDVQKIKE